MVFARKQLRGLCGSRRQKTQPLSDQGQLGQRSYVHFLHDHMSVRLDRPFCRAQCKRNLFVDLASNHQVENLPLTRGQRSNMSARTVAGEETSSSPQLENDTEYS